MYNLSTLPATLLAAVIDLPDHVNSKTIITVRCKCGIEKQINFRSFWRKWAHKDQYLCKSCHIKTYSSTPERIEKFKKSFAKIANTPEHKIKCSIAGKKAWTDPEIRHRITEAVRHDNIVNPKKKVARDIARAALMQKSWFRQHMDEMRLLAAEVIRNRCATDKQFCHYLAKNFKLELEDVKAKHRRSTSAASSLRWRDPIFRAKVIEILNSPSHIELLSENSRKLWQNTEYRQKMLAIYATDAYKQRQSEISREVNSRSEVKLAKANALARQPSISSLEDTLATILTDNNIKFFRQHIVAWYTFDFMIPRPNSTNILLEVNGDWFHSQPQQISRDAGKSTFIRRYHSDQYTLHTIWEHEFGSPQRILSILENFIAGELPHVDFELKDVVISQANSEDIKKFLSKYHYIGKIGRSSYTVAAFHQDVLIACAVFCYPTRMESAVRLQLSQTELYELTRFCIHPVYQKKNFASWFLSRIIKQLATEKPKIKCLLSFADPTFGHTGTIYKAGNWQYDGITEPSYYYRDQDGFIMHKRTLYSYAQKMHMKEAEFAQQYNYSKIKTKSKSRYIYEM